MEYAIIALISMCTSLHSGDQAKTEACKKELVACYVDANKRVLYEPQRTCILKYMEKQ